MKSFVDDFSILQSFNNLKNISNYETEVEALDYNGCKYSHNNKSYVQRTAKVTPKKVGQFVTLWKRNKEGITVPLDIDDSFDFVIIICKLKKNIGRFLFSKEVLSNKGILTSLKNKNNNGKRGFRVYPTWDEPASKQAISTQKWQKEFFLENLSLGYQ